MNEYEYQQLQSASDWRAGVPGPATRTFSRASGPASRVVQTLLPASVLRGARDLVQGAAGRLADRKSILKAAGVETIEALRKADLRDCDQLARRMQWRSSAFGGATGMVFGMAGAPGMALDAVTLLVLSFRTIQRIGLCYGYDFSAEHRVSLGVFALASANDADEKQAALAMLDADEQADLGQWRDGIERAAERELAKDAAKLSLHNLSHQFARRLGMRLGAGALPILGAAIGGGVNAWYLYEVGTAAQRTFQWRWLHERYPQLQQPASSTLLDVPG